MTTQVLTGLLLLVLPVAYNLLFALLARGFDDPGILRQPTRQVLERFAAGGSRLVLLWWGFAMSAVLLAPAVVLLSATLVDADPTVLALATATGLLAALVQLLGLVRWPFVVPHLARLAADPAASPATRDAMEVTFQTLHRYLGVAVGEHLGDLFTGG
jgi:cytochrome bd-type quinol oxidase subunit 2